MAISATLDGTTYNDVTEITVAGAGTTKLIELTESGGGTSFASGSFQPVSDTLTYTVNTGLTEIHGFIFWIPSASTSDAVRAIAFGLVDIPNSFRATVGENTNHTQLWSTPMTNNSGRLAYTIDGGNISMTVSDQNGSGYFVSEHTYQWVAW